MLFIFSIIGAFLGAVLLKALIGHIATRYSFIILFFENILTTTLSLIINIPVVMLSFYFLKMYLVSFKPQASLLSYVPVLGGVISGISTANSFLSHIKEIAIELVIMATLLYIALFLIAWLIEKFIFIKRHPKINFGNALLYANALCYAILYGVTIFSGYLYLKGFITDEITNQFMGIFPRLFFIF